MLGIMVANEIRQIEHERECHCPACCVSDAIRAINIYTAKGTCECPVCSSARAMLSDQARKLQKLFNSYHTIEEEIARNASSPIFIMESQELITTSLEKRGAIVALSIDLKRDMQHFTMLCEAAHTAYEVVEAEMARARIAVLTNRGHDLANQPRDPNDRDPGSFNIN